MQVVVLFLLVSTIAVNRATPATAGAGDVVSTNPNTNAFAAGVNDCRRLPTSRPMNICSIDYEVPAGIAAIAEVIEYEIRGNLEEIGRLARGSDLDTCRSSLLEALCAFRFPRCEGPNVIMRSIPDCTQKTLSCGQGRRLIEVEGICSLNVTVPLNSCKPVTSFPAWTDFQHCRSVVDGSTKITDWMAEYMRLIDAELKAKLDPAGDISSLRFTPACFQRTSRYFCQFYGRCTDGQTIELINSETVCNDFLNCYPDMTAESLRTSVNCASWPLMVGGPGPGSITTKKAATTKSSSKFPQDWPTPYPVGSGCSLQCVTGAVLLTFTLFLNVVLS